MLRSRAIPTIMLLVTLSLGCAAGQRSAIEGLVETADSPADHAKIIEYYQAEAAEAREKAAEHRRLADSYGGRQNWGVAFAERAMAHCMTLARLEEERAASYAQLAAEHERMK